MTHDEVCGTQARGRRAARAGSIVVAAVVLAGCAGMSPEDLGGLFGRGQAPLDEATVASGLREALSVGASRAVERLAERDAIWSDPRLRIPLPDEMQRVASTLRRLGLDRQVDELERAVNRAAERSAAEALDVFRDAIAGLTIEDAFAILRGGETAATDLLRSRTETRLVDRMRPIVHETVSAVGLARAWQDLRERIERLPLVEPPGDDLEAWVATQTVDRLFGQLALEEARIRRDPVARTTELLRRVFGRR